MPDNDTDVPDCEGEHEWPTISCAKCRDSPLLLLKLSAWSFADVGKMLECMRQAKGWTLEQLAEAANMDTSTLGKSKRNGYKNCRVDTICKLISAMGYKVTVQVRDE